MAATPACPAPYRDVTPAVMGSRGTSVALQARNVWSHLHRSCSFSSADRLAMLRLASKAALANHLRKQLRGIPSVVWGTSHHMRFRNSLRCIGEDATEDEGMLHHNDLVSPNETWHSSTSCSQCPNHGVASNNGMEKVRPSADSGPEANMCLHDSEHLSLLAGP